jgi:histidinol-phosphate aminotransferase
MNDRRPHAGSPAAAPAEVAARVAATIRADVRAMRAYAVAKAEGMIKLDAMENPYPLPPVRAKLAAAPRTCRSTAIPTAQRRGQTALAGRWRCPRCGVVSATLTS